MHLVGPNRLCLCHPTAAVIRGGTRGRPGRVSEGAWEGVHAPGVGAPLAGGCVCQEAFGETCKHMPACQRAHQPA